MKLSDYAKERGITYRTAWNRFKTGKIPAAIKDPLTGTIHIRPESRSNNNKVSLYARVSSNEQREDLDRQLIRLREYATVRGLTIIEEIKEIGSGVNDSRKKLIGLLQKNNWNTLIVEHKDRLTRFGFNYIEALLNNQGRKIEVVNLVSDEKSDLIQDMISVLYSFSARMYGRRKTKRKKVESLIAELP